VSHDGEPKQKVLGFVSLLALGINGIVGVGIFVAPPTVARAVIGPRGALLYVAVALGCLPIALAYARLARAMPTDGGPMLYAERAFGTAAARALGVLVWISAIFSTSAVTRALADIVASWTKTPAVAPFAAVGLTLALLVVNLRGLRLSAMAWTILTALKLVPLIIIAVLGAFMVARIAPQPVVTREPASMGRALLAILFALQGFEIVALPAGQARDPARTVPRATVVALLSAGVLYAAIHLGCARALPSLAEEGGAIPAAAAVLGGRWLAWAVSAGVVASIFGIVVGMHAMTPRYLTALVHPGLVTPVDVRSVVITAIVVAPFTAFTSLTSLVNLSSVAVLSQYAVTIVALAVLSWRRREGLRPMDAWPAPLAIVVVAILMAQARLREVGIGLLVALAGALIASQMARRERMQRKEGSPP
jgi:basic amino acid/polyamine antiporter, APA family